MSGPLIRFRYKCVGSHPGNIPAKLFSILNPGSGGRSPLQQCNYQVSKSIVHEIKFGDIAVM